MKKLTIVLSIFVLLGIAIEAHAKPLSQTQLTFVKKVMRAAHNNDEQSLLSMMHTKSVACIKKDEKKYRRTMSLLSRIYGSTEKIESMQYIPTPEKEKSRIENEMLSGHTSWPVVPTGRIKIERKGSRSFLILTTENGKLRFVTGCP